MSLEAIEVHVGDGFMQVDLIDDELGTKCFVLGTKCFDFGVVAIERVVVELLPVAFIAFVAVLELDVLRT